MPDRDRDSRDRGRDRERARERRRHQRRTAERGAAGMCPKCGKAKPAPGRSKCEQCLERARISDRARYARAKAEGRLNGPNGESRRRAASARSRRRYEARRAAGLCGKCGQRRTQEGRSRCEPCLEHRNAADRRQWQLRRSAGRCGPCGAPAPSGAARCERCSTVQAKRPSRKAYARKIYARRKARSECTDCGAYSAGASRCAPCARRSYVRSGEHRGLPAGPPAFHVVEIETGHALSEWETLAEARASLAFARIDPDTVTIEADIPTMSTLASW